MPLFGVETDLEPNAAQISSAGLDLQPSSPESLPTISHPGSGTPIPRGGPLSVPLGASDVPSIGGQGSVPINNPVLSGGSGSVAGPAAPSGNGGTGITDGGSSIDKLIDLAAAQFAGVGAGGGGGGLSTAPLATSSSSTPTSINPIIIVLIVGAIAVGGYIYYRKHHTKKAEQ